MHAYNTVFGFLNEVSGGNLHPPCDASQMDSILVFWGLWDDFDRGKRKFELCVKD